MPHVVAWSDHTGDFDIVVDICYECGTVFRYSMACPSCSLRAALEN